MNLLPNEVVFEIVSYLDLSDLVYLHQVSDRFRTISNQIISEKLGSLKWRLDLYFPPNETPEGALILGYNMKKRKYLKDHIHKKYRKLSVTSRGITREVLQSYPTVKIELPLWNKKNMNIKFLDQREEDFRTEDLAVVDMMW